MKLNDTLGYARSLRKKPDAQDDIRSLALLAAEGAALIDEYFKPCKWQPKSRNTRPLIIRYIAFVLQSPQQDALVRSFSEKLHDFNKKRDSEILGAYNESTSCPSRLKMSRSDIIGPQLYGPSNQLGILDNHPILASRLYPTQVMHTASRTTRDEDHRSAEVPAQLAPPYEVAVSTPRLLNNQH